MRRLTAILALAMISFMVSCGNHEGRAHLELEERQNWEGVELYGDIANIVETSYELAGSYGRTVKTELISKKYVEFNERGDLRLSVEYDVDSLLLEKIEYTYDHKGYLAEHQYQGDGYKFSNRYLRDDYGYVVERTLLKGDGTVDIHYAMTYDKKGNLHERVDYDSNGLVVGRVCTQYNDDNKPVESQRYNGGGELKRREVYTYDAAGRLSEYLACDALDVVESRQEYTYGDNGRDEDVVVYDANGAFESHVARRYDSNDNLIELITYNADGTVVESSATLYNANNQVIEVRHIAANDDVLSLKSYIYDDNGLLVEFTDDDIFHDQYTVTRYRYDKKNNLVEETCFATPRRIAQYVVEYAITYRDSLQ